MPESLTCARCGSEHVVPDARLIDRDAHGSRPKAEVGVFAKPEAKLFKGEARTGVLAEVCADCGHIELYAEDPQPLWDAYQQSRL